MKYLELAEFMHNEYEKIAKKNNWKTQKSTQVSFKRLPLENQQTMIELSKKVFKWFRAEGGYGYDDFFNEISFSSEFFGEIKRFDHSDKTWKIEYIGDDND